VSSVDTCLMQNKIPHCYVTRLKKDRLMTSKLVSSRGKPPLHHINEQFLNDTNDKASFYI